MGVKVTNDDLARQLMDLHKMIGGLQADNQRAAEDRKRSEDIVVRVHERIDGMYARIDSVDGRVDDLASKIDTSNRILLDDVKPQTDRFRQLHSRGAVLIASVGTIGAVMGVKFSGSLQAALEALKQILSR